MRAPYSCGNGFLSSHHLLGAKSKKRTHEEVAKGTTRGYGGTFHFLEGSENRVGEVGAVAAEVLHLSREDLRTHIFICVRRPKRPVQSSSPRGVLYSLLDVKYTNSKEIPLCDSPLQVQIKAL